MKARVVGVVLLALLATSCNTDQVRLGTPIDCDTERTGRLILFAQAVPSAQLIPCLDGLPAGWQIGSIDTRTGEARIELENDTHDIVVAGTFTAACSTGGEPLPTEDPSITAYLQPSLLTFVFDGGCFAIELPGAVTAQEADALLAALAYISRDSLRATTGWTL